MRCLHVCCVHHCCCQEKLDNVAPWGLASGHRIAGTIRAWQSEHWLLVGEECFNFLTNKSGQGEIGHPRLDNASAWLISLNFKPTTSNWYCSLRFEEDVHWALLVFLYLQLPACIKMTAMLGRYQMQLHHVFWTTQLRCFCSERF